jgi:hypothetical protein
MFESHVLFDNYIPSARCLARVSGHCWDQTVTGEHTQGGRCPCNLQRHDNRDNRDGPQKAQTEAPAKTSDENHNLDSDLVQARNLSLRR